MLLDLGILLKVLGHAQQQHFGQGGVLDLTAPEDYGALHLVPRLEEANCLADAHLVVVGIDLVSHLHLLDLGLVRFLLGLLGLLLLLKLVFAVIHHPTDGRVGLLAHQHQVKLSVLSHLQSRFPGDHPQLTAVGINHPEVGVADAFVDVGQLPHGSTAVKTRTGGHQEGLMNS